MSFLHGSELADRQQVDPAQEPEAPLHQFLPLPDPLDRFVIAELREGLCWLHPEAFEEHPLGVRDPTLDVAPRAIVLLVLLAQPVELHGGLSP